MICSHKEVFLWILSTEQFGSVDMVFFDCAFLCYCEKNEILPLLYGREMANVAFSFDGYMVILILGLPSHTVWRQRQCLRRKTLPHYTTITRKTPISMFFLDHDIVLEEREREGNGKRVRYRCHATWILKSQETTFCPQPPVSHTSIL